MPPSVNTTEPASPSVGSGGLVRLRLDVAYDGSGFAGWARQPGQRTVQGDLESALRTVLRLESTPALTVAGRTDAGVHARGQVCHFDLPECAWAASAERLVRHLAGVLPADVRVRRVAPAPEGFDARFSALARRYAYRLVDDAAAVDPLLRGHVVAHPRSVDVAAMTDAAGGLLGEHDFAAYCRQRVGATTVRRLVRLECTRTPDGLVVLDVEADAFCHQMVRSLVGALVAVGEGRRGTEWPAALLAARQREPAVTVMPARGLTLEEVRYPPADQLAARATRTRTRAVRASQ